MPSPFPGMDPYVESQWRSFHGLMISSIVSALNKSLPPGLAAQMDEEVRVETLSGESLYNYGPDVVMVRRGTVSPSSTGAAAVLAEPLRMKYRRAPIVLRSIQIVDRSIGHRIVTTIELLSPWNKLPGRLNRDYRRKIADYESSDTNWVEIDLLRSSRKRLAVPWDLVPAAPELYLVACYRPNDDDLSVYPNSIRQRLPMFAIPLREGDADVALDLQAAFDRTYSDGFERSIDYSIPPDPPLSPDDAEWAKSLITERRPQI